MSLAEIGQDQSIIAAVVLGALFILVLLTATQKSSRRRSRREGGRPTNGGPRAPFTVDVGAQMNAVMSAPFEKRRIMNRSEYRAFKIVETELANIPHGFRLFAQTSLGEVLSSSSPNAYRAINAKRVDMLIVDAVGLPALAIEYQGERHYQGNAAARDAIKKEALRKAGVRYLEIPAEFSEEQIRQRLHEQLGSEQPLTKSA